MTERTSPDLDRHEQMAGLVSLFEGVPIFEERSGNSTSHHAVIHWNNPELEDKEVSEGHDVTSGRF
jgi:hypothetical protein